MSGELIELKPCPFCGAAPQVSTYETESLWSHNQVTYTQVECHDCEISFHSEPGYEAEAAEQWNRRTTPEGYVIVPVEPTHEMEASGIITFMKVHSKPTPFILDQVYKAMIKAAQKEGK